MPEKKHLQEITKKLFEINVREGIFLNFNIKFGR